MSYTPTKWVDGTTPVNAQNMNKIEEGIRQLDTNKLDADKLPEAVNDALAQAKASGAFDGADGQPGADGKDGNPGKDGADGKTPVRGTDYYTEADKTEMVNAVIAALPKYDGEVVGV